MKYSIFTWYGYDLPIEERLQLIKNAGFDAVMLWWGFDDRHYANTYARKIGLEVENAHLMYYKSNDIWENENGIYTKNIIEGITECANANISTIVMHVNTSRISPQINKIGLNNFESILNCAQKKNVKIAIENCAYYEPIKYILDNFNSNSLGFCYDSGHELLDMDKADYLNDFGSRLLAMHLADNHGNNDAHLLPFDGIIDWDKKKRQLTDNCTFDYVSLEASFNYNYEESNIYSNISAEDFLKSAFEKAKRLA